MANTYRLATKLVNGNKVTTGCHFVVSVTKDNKSAVQHLSNKTTFGQTRGSMKVGRRRK